MIGYIGKLYPYSTRWEENILVIIFMEIDPFVYYFVINKIQNISNDKYKECILLNINPETNIKGYMWPVYTLYTRWNKLILLNIHIYGYKAILLLFFDDKYIKYE